MPANQVPVSQVPVILVIAQPQQMPATQPTAAPAAYSHHYPYAAQQMPVQLQSLDLKDIKESFKAKQEAEKKFFKELKDSKEDFKEKIKKEAKESLAEKLKTIGETFKEKGKKLTKEEKLQLLLLWAIIWRRLQIWSNLSLFIQYRNLDEHSTRFLAHQI